MLPALFILPLHSPVGAQPHGVTWQMGQKLPTEQTIQLLQSCGLAAGEFTGNNFVGSYLQEVQFFFRTLRLES